MTNAEDRVFGDLLHVHVRGLVETAERAWPARDADVDGREEYVQVLGVGDEDEKARDHRDVQEKEDCLQHAVHSVAEWREPTRHHVRGEGPRRGELGAERPQLRRRPVGVMRRKVREGEVSGVDLRRTIDKERDDHGRDHREDQPRRRGVTAEEATLALLLRGRVFQSDDREDDERHQHRRGEEVLHEGQPVALTDPRNVEVAIEQRAVRLEDGREQDGEAPHREEVRQSRHRPAKEFALSGDFGDFRVGDLAKTLPASRRGLTAADEARQPVETSRGDAKAHDRDDEPDDDAS